MTAPEDAEFEALRRRVTRQSVVLGAFVLVAVTAGFLAIAYVVTGLMPDGF